MPIYNPPPTAVPSAHHTTHETGGTDVVAAIDGSVITSGAVAAARGGTGTTTGLTLLNASNVTTGTLPVAQLPANVARTDAANIFTGNPQVLSSASPGINLTDTSQAANLRIFYIQNTSQGLYFRAFDDTLSPVINPLFLTRSGDAAIARDLYEKGRTTPMGHWIDVPFNAANFTATAGTWTVTAGNVLMNAYTLIGKTLYWVILIAASSVSATTPDLRITLPAGLSISRYSETSFAASDNGAIVANVTGQLAPGVSYLALHRDLAASILWSAGSGTQIRGTVIGSLA